MRLAATIVTAAAVLISTATATAQITPVPTQIPSMGLSGELVRIVPQSGLVMRTRDGRDVAIPVTRTNRVNVYAPVDLKDVPDGAPCRIATGQIKKGSRELATTEIRIITPTSNDVSGELILVPSGDVEFTLGVPGLLKKGPPLAFQIGAARYRVRNLMGQHSNAPPEQQNALLNQVLPLVKRGDTEIRALYDFGSNLEMAGANALVTVYASTNPANAAIRLYRTEPLPPPTTPAKKK